MRRTSILPLSLATALLATVLAGPAHAGDAKKGKMVYTSRCAFCHGASGKGDGPAGAALKPPPTDFTNPEVWKNHSLGELRDMVRDGKPGSAMIPFKSSLTDEQLENLMDYLETFKPQ